MSFPLKKEKADSTCLESATLIQTEETAKNSQDP